ncbi:MAG: outer membrane beta-barrel protein [Rhodobacteraceae bacterium]|nr:outer membrane beta-barrel protein [Paracoccaceae bacterium]
MKTRNKLCAASAVAVALSCSPALANEFEFGIILQAAQYERKANANNDIRAVAAWLQSVSTITGSDSDETGQAFGLVSRYTIPTANGGFIGFQSTLAAENTSFQNSIRMSGASTEGSQEFNAEFSADFLFLAGINATDSLSFYGGVGLSAAQFEASVSFGSDSISDSQIHYGPKVAAGVNYQLAEGYKLFAQLEHTQYDEEAYFGVPSAVAEFGFDQTKLGIGVLFSF